MKKICAICVEGFLFPSHRTGVASLLITTSLLFQSTYSAGQGSVPENMPITDTAYPTGISFQTGPGANNAADNWTYPYGTKLTINHSVPRNLEIMAIDKDARGIVYRQFSQFTNAWTPWRNILAENPNGGYGISVGTPLAKLHVHEEGELETAEGNYRALLQVSGAVGNGNIFRRNLWVVRDAANTGWYYSRLMNGISIDGSYDDPATARTWWTRDPKDNIQSWGSGPSPYMTLSGSRLGIGTTTPSASLEVWGPAIIRESDSGHAPDNVGGLFVHNSGSSNGYYVFQTATTGGGKSFSITNAGRVGIGTTAPDSRLTVKGAVHAEEVKVDLSIPAPDYVFEENYTLPSLVETKKYIQEHKHLPEVPSAADMEANGINVGEMNLILLKKVEELTLHVIRQQEEIQALKKQLNKDQ